MVKVRGNAVPGPQRVGWRGGAASKAFGLAISRSRVRISRYRVTGVPTESLSQEINSFGWYNDTVKNSSVTTKHLYLILTFRSHHEIFIRRSWYSVRPSLGATISCRIKKAVVGETGRKLGARLHEHKTEVESKTKRAYTIEVSAQPV